MKLIKVLKGQLDGPNYFFTPEGKKVVYVPGGFVFEEYLRERPETVLCRWDNYMGRYVFHRSNIGEIESVSITPPPAKPWHKGLPATDLKTVPHWVLEALDELGEISQKGVY